MSAAGESPKNPAEVITEQVLYLALETILPNPAQPREDFTSPKAVEALAGLASSIRKEGVIQPIIVTPILTLEQAQAIIPADKLPDGMTHESYVGKHLIIAGQRRWMASAPAGKKVIPAIVRNIKPEELLVLSATENLTRQDMTVLEEAKVYEFHCKQGWSDAVIATQYGKHRTHITNMRGLLELPKEVLDELSKGDSPVTMGHARNLKSLKEHPDLILAFLKRILEDGVSVRWTEEQVREAQAKIKKDTAPDAIEDAIATAPKTPTAPAATDSAAPVAPTGEGDAAPAAPAVAPAEVVPTAAENVTVPDEVIAAVKALKNVLRTQVKYVPGSPESHLVIQLFGMSDLARLLIHFGVAADVANAVLPAQSEAN